MGTSTTSTGVYSVVGDNFFTALGAVAGGIVAAVVAPEIVVAGAATLIGTAVGGVAAHGVQRALRGSTASTDPSQPEVQPTTLPRQTQPQTTQPQPTNQPREPIQTRPTASDPTAKAQTEVPKEPEKPKLMTDANIKQLSDMATGTKRATPANAAPEEKTELDNERQRIIAAVKVQNLAADRFDTLKSDLDKLQRRVDEITALADKRGKTAAVQLKRLDEAKNQAPTGADPAEVKSMQDERERIRSALTTGLSDGSLKQATADIDKLPVAAQAISVELSNRTARSRALLKDLDDTAHGKPPPNDAKASEKQDILQARAAITASLKVTNPTKAQISAAEAAIQKLANDVTALNGRISNRATRQTTLLNQLTIENKALPDATPQEAKALSDEHKNIQDGLNGLNLTDDKIDTQLDTAEKAIAAFAGEVKKVEAAIGVRTKATAAIVKAAREVWNEEKDRLMGLVTPRELFDVQNRPAWQKKLSDVTDPEWLALWKPLEQAMVNVTGQKQLKEAAKTVIDAGKAAREKTWTTAMWAEVATKKRGTTTTPRVAPTRDAIWRWLQWGSISGRNWNLRVIRPASGPRKELHITVSGDSIPEPADVINSDPSLLDKSPGEIFDTLFQHQSRNLRVHVTKGDEASYRQGLNEHLFIGDACGDGDFGGDGAEMKKGLQEFRASAIKYIISAKMRDWAI